MRHVLLILCVLLLAACDRTPSVADEPMELRQYTVPVDRTDAIVGTLNGVMLGTEHQPGIGRASSRVEGQVVVLAPARMHASIEKTVASLSQVGADRADRNGGSVRVDYWVVDAVPGTATDDPALADIQAALDAARPALGSVGFRRRAQVSLVSSTKHNSSASTRGALRITQSTSAVEGGVYLQIELARHGATPAEGDLDLNVAAEVSFGNTLVLAQQDAGGEDDGVRRLVLVRAQPVGAP